MNKQDILKLKPWLDECVEKYNHIDFIELDPICIPHKFSKKEDIEIAGFFAAIFAWGNRTTIINKTKTLMENMDDSPFEFIMNHYYKDLESLKNFKHRTFNYDDLQFFIKSLQNIYLNFDGLERQFLIKENESNAYYAIERFRKTFFSTEHLKRSEKHISSPAKNSAAKRINLFLRWMIRKDKKGVDFGIWESIPMSKLSCPLDVHSGNVAREIKLLSRKQNDWKAVLELDTALRILDKSDPIKYDFALFGYGEENK